MLPKRRGSVLRILACLVPLVGGWLTVLVILILSMTINIEGVTRLNIDAQLARLKFLEDGLLLVLSNGLHCVLFGALWIDLTHRKLIQLLLTLCQWLNPRLMIGLLFILAYWHVFSS